MDKSNVTFLILCILIVCATFGIYKYNSNKYATQSVMEVLPIDDTTETIGTSYIISDTTITERKNITYLITTTTNIETEINTTIDTTIDTTHNTTIVTTSDTTSISKTIISKDTEPETIETEPNFPISLNSITFEELQYINGIGEVTAQKIIDYRNTIGCYTSRYQLLEINGIGESKMNTIMEYTYIENENISYNEDTPQEDDIEYPIEVEEISEDTNIVEETIPKDTESPYPIDLNTATLNDLLLIPNMNQDIAQEILNLRDTIQYYSNPYELLYVDGITEKYLSDMMEYITVN